MTANYYRPLRAPTVRSALLHHGESSFYGTVPTLYIFLVSFETLSLLPVQTRRMLCTVSVLWDANAALLRLLPPRTTKLVCLHKYVQCQQRKTVVTRGLTVLNIRLNTLLLFSLFLNANCTRKCSMIYCYSNCSLNHVRGELCLVCICRRNHIKGHFASRCPSRCCYPISNNPIATHTETAFLFAL